MPDKKMVDARCPHCGKNLMDETQISRETTVHLLAKQSWGEQFHLYLSSIWGNFKTKTVPEQKIEKGEKLELYCPHCKEELPKFHDSCMCGGKIYQILNKLGLFGNVFFCSTVGCRWHKMQNEQIPTGKTPSGV
ncbi:MAG: hypothetical protein PHH83_00980 [Patescibacteria group bacterium]|nr:hypothetical protein [Patescibacteria group bacterium]